MQLRPYQLAAVDSLRRGLKAGHQRQILAAPTGAGKTEMAASIIQMASAKRHKTLFVVERLELVRQSAERFQRIGLQVGVIQAENTLRLSSEGVVVASIQTIARRLAKLGREGFADFGLVIIDECHILHNAHTGLMDALCVPVVGLSATPERKGIGGVFSNMVIPATIEELTKEGYLVPLKCYGPAEPDLARVATVRGDYDQKGLAKVMRQKAVVSGAVEAWQRLGENRQTICFAVDIAHSKDMVDAFRAAGIKAEHIDTYTDSDERRAAIEGFRHGHIKLLSSVGVLAVGFDAPIASCAIMARPTKSLALYIQQAGRVIRPYEGKENAILLDLAGNVARHGLPTHYTPSKLYGGEAQKTRKKPEERKATPCPECAAMMPPQASACPECGYKKPSGVVFVDADLRLIESAPDSPETFLAELVGYAMEKGINPGWAWHCYADKYGHKPHPDLWNRAKAAPARPRNGTLIWIKARKRQWRASHQNAVINQ